MRKKSMVDDQLAKLQYSVCMIMRNVESGNYHPAGMRYYSPAFQSRENVHPEYKRPVGKR